MTDSIVAEKFCNKCSQLLPVDKFYKESARPDGYGIYCKPCMNQYRPKKIIPPPIENLPDEVWLSCIQNTNYEVSNMGRVKRVRFHRYTRQYPRLVRPQRTIHGYLFVTLKTPKRTPVHQLVCRAFHGKPLPEQTDVNHIDNDRANNRADNLHWATRKENLWHGKNQGRDNKGERNGRAILQPDQVRSIKHLLSTTKMTQGEIGALFGVTEGAVQAIKVGKNWKHIKP